MCAVAVVVLQHHHRSWYITTADRHTAQYNNNHTHNMKNFVAIIFVNMVAARPDGPVGHHGVHTGVHHPVVSHSISHHQPVHHAVHHHQPIHHTVHHQPVHHAVHHHQPVQHHSVVPVVAKAAPPTIAELVVSDSRFSTLLAAVKAAGLVETLSGAGPFTVFAPTNAAFQKVSYYDFLMIERLTDD